LARNFPSFIPNLFTFGEATAERLKAALLSHRVFAIFAFKRIKSNNRIVNKFYSRSILQLIFCVIWKHQRSNSLPTATLSIGEVIFNIERKNTKEVASKFQERCGTNRKGSEKSYQTC